MSKLEVNNLDVRDDNIKHPTLPKTGELKPNTENIKKPVPDTELNLSDMQNIAQKEFLNNLPAILQTALTGNTARIVLVGIILLLMLFFGLKGCHIL